MTEVVAGEPIAAQLRSWVMSQTGRRQNGLAVFAGSLSVLSLAPFFLWPILFITLPVFVWLIDSALTPKAAAIEGWLFGFGFFFFGLFWIGEAFLVEAGKFAWLLPFAVTLLPAGLALFWAAAAWAARLIWPTGFARVLVFAITFCIAEYLRGHILTGLPWNILGYALTYPLTLMQSAGIFGIYGLTLIAAVIFAGPLVILADREAGAFRRATFNALALAVFPLLAMWAYGAWRLSEPQAFVDGVKVRIVQPSVLQTEKWQPELQKRIFDDHLALSKTNPNGAQDNLAGITHVIWPEAAMPFLPLETPQALVAIGDILPPGTTLISGALRRAAPSLDTTGPAALTAAAYNSILVFDDQAQLAAVYDKIHLVPFGEFIPFESLLRAAGLDALTFGRSPFTPGTEPHKLMQIAGLPPVLGIVCYEALFPDELGQSPTRAGLIINVTNDGWFGNTTGPRQHFHQTRVRAVEQGLPILRAANNGISGVIDGHGRVLAAIGMNERGTIDTQIPVKVVLPPFAQFGETIFLLQVLLFSALACALNRHCGR